MHQQKSRQHDHDHQTAKDEVGLHRNKEGKFGNRTPFAGSNSLKNICENGFPEEVWVNP
jgi:hypothetical protein